MVCLVRFTAIRARVSVITCYAHSEMVELQYWLLLMLPLVGLVCIKSDKSDPFVSTFADPLVHLKKNGSPRNEEKERRIIIIKISTWLDAQWWLVEHSDWTWAKATSDWTLVPDPLEENERSSSRHGSLGHGLLDRWWSRDYYFEPHNSDPARSLHAGWDAGFCCPKGRYDLVSLIISIYIHLYLSKLKICNFKI